MGDLLRLGRVLQLGLRVIGRHRAATVVALVLAVGYLVMSAGTARAAETDSPTPSESPSVTESAAPTEEPASTTPDPAPTVTATVTESTIVTVAPEPVEADPVCTTAAPCVVSQDNDQYAAILLAAGLVVLGSVGSLVLGFSARGN